MGRPRRWLCGLLAVEAAGVWLLASLPGSSAVGTAAMPDVPVVPGPIVAPETPVGGLAERILARPLFMPGRRPAETGEVAAKAGPAVAPRLAGIVVSKVGRRAIFAPGDSAVPVAEGGRIGVFQVVAIRADAVELDGPGGRSTLRPGPDRGLPAGPAAVAAPVPLLDPYRREAETESDQ